MFQTKYKSLYYLNLYYIEETKQNIYVLCGPTLIQIGILNICVKIPHFSRSYFVKYMS